MAGNDKTKQSLIIRIIPIITVFAAVLSMYLWLSSKTTVDMTLRVPITENNQRENRMPNVEFRNSQGTLVRFDGVPAMDLPGAWPRFRGPNLDAISRENSEFRIQPPIKSGAEIKAPKELWSVEMGEGYAGAAVLGGRVYVVDYDQQNRADVIRCMSLTDGRDIWRYSYPVEVRRNHGMSRTVPAVTEKYLVALGPKCHLTCLDSKTGEFRWMFDLVRDFKAEVPPWYAGQCPLIEEDNAIIAVGGDCLMMAVDCETGKIIWQSPNPHNWKMTHSSIMPMELAGQRMYIYCASGGVVGISAQDGRILWQFDQWKIRIANVPSPVIVGDGLFLLSGGYNAGSMMLRLIRDGDKITVQQVFHLDSDTFGAPQHTPILYEGNIYGVRQDGQLVCIDLSGKVLWTSSGASKFGLGPYTVINGMIYAMNDNGLLKIIEATPSGYVQLAEAKVLEGPESWGPMAVASGRLIVRDLTRMKCLEISKM